jgi:hypothetical protein
MQAPRLYGTCRHIGISWRRSLGGQRFDRRGEVKPEAAGWRWLAEPGLRSSCRSNNIALRARSGSSRLARSRGPLSTAGSTVLSAVRVSKSAATSRQECGAAMSRTQSTQGHLQEKRRGRRRSSRQGQRSAGSAADWLRAPAHGHAAGDAKRNSVRSRHMLWSTTASLRATATNALRRPIRSASARPHTDSGLGRAERRSRTLAAS